MVQFLIFGDSITYGAWDTKGGWVGRLKYLATKKSLNSNYYGIVHNLGISGDTTSDVLERLKFESKQRLKEKDPTIIIFEVGANDTIIDEDGNIKTPKEEFEYNIENLIKTSKEYSLYIVFMSLLPVDESKTNPVSWDSNVYYENKYLQEYNEVIKSVCGKHINVDFIDNFENWIKSDYTKLLEDGVHPNSRGHARIFSKIKDILDIY